jgi:hypothetical protein
MNAELEKTFKTPLKIDLTPPFFSYAQLKSRANNCSNEGMEKNLTALGECLRDGGLVKVVKIPPKDGKTRGGVGLESQSYALWTGNLGWKKVIELLNLIFDETKGRENLIEEIKNSVKENREVVLQIKK